MRIVSVDPGVCKMGLAIHEEGVLTQVFNVRLIPEEINWKEYKRKKGAETETEIIREALAALFQFMEGNEVVLIEKNSIKFSHAIGCGLAGGILEKFPENRIVFIHPYSVSRYYKIGGLTRPDRKARIRALLEKFLPQLNFKKLGLTQDQMDALLNIFYFMQRKDKKPKEACPSWSYDSQSLGKLSFLTAIQSASMT